MEQGVKVSKNVLVSVCSIIEFLNNKFDPLDIVLDGWSEDINESVDHGDYDEVLEDLYEKYQANMQMSPEMKLLFMVGGSAVKFHLTRTVLKTIIPNAETLLKQNPKLKNDISNMISKNISQDVKNNINNSINPTQVSGLTNNMNNMNGINQMKGPNNVDNILKELEAKENAYNYNNSINNNSIRMEKNTVSITDI